MGRKPEAGSRKPEAGSRKPEAGSRKPDGGPVPEPSEPAPSGKPAGSGVTARSAGVRRTPDCPPALRRPPRRPHGVRCRQRVGCRAGGGARGRWCGVRRDRVRFGMRSRRRYRVRAGRRHRAGSGAGSRPRRTGARTGSGRNGVRVGRAGRSRRLWHRHVVLRSPVASLSDLRLPVLYGPMRSFKVVSHHRPRVWTSDSGRAYSLCDGRDHSATRESRLVDGAAGRWAGRRGSCACHSDAGEYGRPERVPRPHERRRQESEQQQAEERWPGPGLRRGRGAGRAPVGGDPSPGQSAVPR